MSFNKDEMLVLPAVDIKNGKCVQLVQGQPGSEMVEIENPEKVALHWENEGAKNIHVIDLDDVTFLDAEQVGFRLIEHPDHGFAPVIPAVVAVKIFSGRKADVERHHADVGLVA